VLRIAVHYVILNIGYHHIHHLNARIPFYRLPEAVRGIPELMNPRSTSLHPMEILRCLRLKVWDVEAQRMVGISGLKPVPAGKVWRVGARSTSRNRVAER